MSDQVAFIALPAVRECPAQAQGQLFVLTITSHWQTGMSGEFCLRVPRDFNGDWKIRFEFDQKGITGVEVRFDSNERVEANRKGRGSFVCLSVGFFVSVSVSQFNCLLAVSLLLSLCLFLSLSLSSPLYAVGRMIDS